MIGRALHHDIILFGAAKISMIEYTGKKTELTPHTAANTGSLPATKVAASTGYRGVNSGTDSPSALSRIPFRTVFILVGVVGSLFLMAYLLWDHGVIKVPFLQNPVIKRQLERYATVGPVMLSVGENQHVKVSVNVECKNKKLKKRLAKMDSALRNRILMVMDRPEVKDLIEKQDYESLKPLFEKEINKLIPKNTIENIHYIDIIRY